VADSTAVILAGGDLVSPDIRRVVPEHALVIAADSGLTQARPLGLTVDVVVGDLDSVDPIDLAAAEAAGAEVVRHPVDKDHTDLELALLTAADRGASRAVVIGGSGGRLDHFLANALVLASPEHTPLVIEAYVGAARLAVARPATPVEIVGRPGDLCSLLALGGRASGVSTRGLRFALDGEALHPGSTRGVSNEMTATRAAVTVETGTVLVVQPEYRHQEVESS